MHTKCTYLLKGKDFRCVLQHVPFQAQRQLCLPQLFLKYLKKQRPKSSLYRKILELFPRLAFSTLASILLFFSSVNYKTNLHAEKF